jgi:AAA ATPase containing von Willebrand factor type A (vWA) domain
MADTTNDVDILEEEVENTETTLDTENNEDITEEITEKTDDTDSTDDEIDDEIIRNLNDDEFNVWIETGKLPDSAKKPKTKETEDVDTSTTSSDTENRDDNKSNDSLLDSKSNKSGKADVKQPKEEIKKDTKSDTDRESTTKSTQTEKGINYKNAYEAIFKPFKANGKDIAPKTVEDVISLMQMGANYTKKMQTMASMRKTVESLNKANIKDEDLNFLIDVHNGDTEAIKKLLEKHKVDPIELDMDSTNYVPKNNIVSDADVKFKEVLEEAKESLPKIQDVINNVWDAASKTKILEDPALLRALHQEISMGRFDEAQAELEAAKTFGRYANVTDLEAYIDIVSKMHAKTLTKNNINTSTNKVISKPSNTLKNNIPDKSKVAPTRSKQGSTKANITSKDIFNMSEEDFNKLDINSII